MKRSKTRPPFISPLVLGIFLLLLYFSVCRVSGWVQAQPAMGEAQPTATAQPQLFVPRVVSATKYKPKVYAVALGDEPAPLKQETLVQQAKTHVTSGPTILIYHTHTTEAYTPTDENPYKASSSYRTREQDKSVVAVGEALKKELEAYGYVVLHDTTDHEPPKLATAYERSEVTMEAYKEKYPSLELFIDLHRDASSDTTDYVLVNGQPTAKVMCVVGKGEKYDIKPDFDSNLALAQAFTDSLNDLTKGLGRQVRIKPGRYNQHISSHCLLLEVGHNANTLKQALNAVPYMAKALHEALSSEPEIEEKAERLPLVPVMSLT